MYKRSVLFYFSGTGNTKLISEAIKNRLSESMECDIVPITDSLVDIDLIRIGFPVYGFYCPSIIHEFIKKFLKAIRIYFSLEQVAVEAT